MKRSLLFLLAVMFATPLADAAMSSTDVSCHFELTRKNDANYQVLTTLRQFTKHEICGLEDDAFGGPASSMSQCRKELLKSLTTPEQLKTLVEQVAGKTGVDIGKLQKKSAKSLVRKLFSPYPIMVKVSDRQETKLYSKNDGSEKMVRFTERYRLKKLSEVSEEARNSALKRKDEYVIDVFGEPYLSGMGSRMTQEIRDMLEIIRQYGLQDKIDALLFSQYVDHNNNLTDYYADEEWLGKKDRSEGFGEFFVVPGEFSPRLIVVAAKRTGLFRKRIELLRTDEGPLSHPGQVYHGATFYGGKVKAEGQLTVSCVNH